MKIIISGKQLKITDAIKNYTEEKISRISKYSDAITEIDVVLTVEDTKSEGPVHKADGLVFASGTKVLTTKSLIYLFGSSVTFS